MTKTKDVQGHTWKTADVGLFVIPRTITVRVSSDEIGKSLSLTDDLEGIQLVVPLEPLADMLEVVEE